jgi:hypothetical protein
MMFALFVLLLCVAAFNAYANPACAVCTVAVGASLEIARRMGVDDGVVGVWAGAFLMLIGYWTLKWMDKKGWHFRGRDFVVLASSVLMILFMYVSELVYTPKAILVFWVDPFLFATVCGALVLHYSSEFYQWMKRNNGGHAHFPFEKVAVPVVALCLTAKLFSYLQLCAKGLPDLSQF